MELVTQENKATSRGGGKSVSAALGWGALGSLVLGPIGGVAGLVFGGRKSPIISNETNIFFALYLSDGKKYLISSDLYTFQTIKAMYFSKPNLQTVGSQQVQTPKKESGAYIKCDSCNYKLPADSKFCTNCGGKIEYLFCKYCGSKILSISSYCKSCGKNID